MSYAFTVAGRKFTLEREQVEAAVADKLPEPLREHFVVVNALRWPPKQVLEAATGVDRADFTTHQARRILSRLGLVAGRRSRRAERLPEPPERTPSEHARRQAEALRPFRGKWVALGEPDEVLVAAETPQEVIAWLRTHDITSSMMFRVPVPGQMEIIGPRT